MTPIRPESEPSIRNPPIPYTTYGKLTHKEPELPGIPHAWSIETGVLEADGLCKVRSNIVNRRI